MFISGLRRPSGVRWRPARVQQVKNTNYAMCGFEPSVAQPPLPLQEFLPLQPLSLALQPPWPLQSFFPLQECLAVSSKVAFATDTLPADALAALTVVVE